MGKNVEYFVANLTEPFLGPHRNNRPGLHLEQAEALGPDNLVHDLSQGEE